MGRRGGPEESSVPGAGFELETLYVRGFDRDALWKNIALPLVVPAAIVRARTIIERFLPDVVLGTGAYVMLPTVLAARTKGVPYVLVAAEATGLATRMLASRAAAVCVTFQQTRAQIPSDRVEVTGFPLREGFRPGAPRVPARRLLVMGGSQGARRLNQAVWGGLEDLCRRFETVTHLTGAQGQEEGRAHHRPGYEPIAFSDRMPELMARADLVVCRAGVGTIAELTAVGLPAIVVPGQFGGAHQVDNAQLLASAGVAEVISDAGLTTATLIRAIDSLTDDRLAAMAVASRAMGRPHAAASVLKVLRSVAARR